MIASQGLTFRFKNDFFNAGQVARVRAANHFIAIARGFEADHQCERALLYLQARVDHYLLNGEYKGARIAAALLDETEKMFERINRPEYFMMGLQCARNNFDLKRLFQARMIISQVIGFINGLGIPDERDNIRIGVAMTYLDLGQIENAIRVAGGIESVTGKRSAFNLFVNVFAGEARNYEKSGEKDKALFILKGRTDLFISNISNHREVAKALLDEGVRIFEAADDPNLYDQGLKLAAGYCLIGSEEDSMPIFMNIRGLIDRSDYRVERDEMRHEMVMTYQSVGKMDEAIGIAREIDFVENKCFAFRMIAGVLIGMGAVDKAKEFMLGDYLPTVRTIAAIEFAGQYDYTERATKMMHAAGLFDRIGEGAEAEKIRKEVKSLQGSFFVIPEDLD